VIIIGGTICKWCNKNKVNDFSPIIRYSIRRDRRQMRVCDSCAAKIEKACAKRLS
jgi:hypothetical protein